MTFVVVCPLSQVSATVDRYGATRLVSLIDAETLVVRPRSIPPENHLYLGIHDITEPMEGLILPDEEHVGALIAFVEGWDRKQPMVVHCYAGISRSTAAAFIASSACRTPIATSARSCPAPARRLGDCHTQCARLIALADQPLLDRNGRMIAAIAEIGRQASSRSKGVPFAAAPSRTAVETNETPPRIEIGLNAAIVAVQDQQPLILAQWPAMTKRMRCLSGRSTRCRTARWKPAFVPGWPSRPN